MQNHDATKIPTIDPNTHVKQSSNSSGAFQVNPISKLVGFHTRRSLASPLSQTKYLQRRLVHAAQHDKCTGNTLALIARSWAALEVHRVALSTSLASKRQAEKYAVIHPGDSFPVEADPANEVTFVESMPEELANEDLPNIVTRKTPPNPNPRKNGKGIS